MSFSDVRPYFRAMVKNTDPNLKEWGDGFSEDNIPKTLIDKRCFHLLVGRFNTVALNQDCVEASGSCIVNLYFDGTKDPQKAIDDIIVKGQAIVKEALRPQNRAAQVGIKNVRLTNFDPSPLSGSNDTIVRLSIEFNLTILLELT